MNYPILCINIKVSESSQFGEVLEKGQISTIKIDWFSEFYLNSDFCDSFGRVYKLVKLTPIRRDWNLFHLIGNNFKVATIFQCEFEETNQLMNLNDFKSCCKEISKHMFVEDVWAKTFKEIDEGKDYIAAMDNFRIK